MNRISFLIITIVASPVVAQDSTVTFREVTEKARIDFRYTFGDFTYDNILESSGSGVTVIDYDGDGDLDLYMLNGTYLEDISDPKGRVFRNTPNRFTATMEMKRLRKWQSRPVWTTPIGAWRPLRLTTTTMAIRTFIF